jgi:hypothetical protein
LHDILSSPEDKERKEVARLEKVAADITTAAMLEAKKGERRADFDLRLSESGCTYLLAWLQELGYKASYDSEKNSLALRW